MAKTKTFQPLMPWEDRWQQPNVESLLKPIKDPQIKPFRALMERLEAFEHVHHDLQWQGLSWKWTFVYNHGIAESQDKHAGLKQFAYLVPRPGSVMICVPLTTEFIYALPMRRLNRYIRDGIRVAKCAVNIHWATWTPMAMTEVEHLHDLLKRKDRFITGESAQKQKAAEQAEEKSATTSASTKKSSTKATDKKTSSKSSKKSSSKKSSTSKADSKKTSKKAKTTKKSTGSSKTTKKSKSSSSSSRSKKKK